MNLSQWLEDLKSYGDPDLTVVVVGNKSDLCQSTSDNPDSTASLSRQVTHEEALSWAEERGLEYIETSAKTGDNVEEVERLMPPISFATQQTYSNRIDDFLRLQCWIITLLPQIGLC